MMAKNESEDDNQDELSFTDLDYDAYCYLIRSFTTHGFNFFIDLA